MRRASRCIWSTGASPSLNLLLAKGVLGEVRREGAAFTAELRSLAHRLNEESGRLYTATCSADLGDARCTIDLGNVMFRGSGAIASLAGTSAFRASGIGGFADGWFTAGKLAFTSGANAGFAVEVKMHRVALDGVLIELWQRPPEPIAVSDAFTVTAGCDKRFATCRDRFANAVNFRGFPHIPGNDFVISYPVPGRGSGRPLLPWRTQAGSRGHSRCFGSIRIRSEVNVHGCGPFWIPLRKSARRTRGRAPRSTPSARRSNGSWQPCGAILLRSRLRSRCAGSD